MVMDVNGGMFWLFNWWKIGVNCWLEGYDYGYYIDVYVLVFS